MFNIYSLDFVQYLKYFVILKPLTIESLSHTAIYIFAGLLWCFWMERCRLSGLNTSSIVLPLL